MALALPEFRNIVETAVGGRPITRIATSAGLPRDAIRSVVKNGHDPTFSRVSEICAALDLELYVGPPRHQADLPVFQSQFDALKKDICDIQRGLQAILKATPTAPAVHVVPRTVNAEAVQIMELDAATSGRMANLKDGVLGKPIWFRNTWINRHKIDPDQSVVISVRGDCMGPTIPDGSKILVDRSRQQRRPGHIYVITMDEGIVLKRIVKSRGEWVMVSDSDSEDWPDIPWPNDANIIGEVKWMSRVVP